MQPEIHQEGPGSCSVSRLALGSKTVTGESGPNLELTDMTRRFPKLDAPLTPAARFLPLGEPGRAVSVP